MALLAGLSLPTTGHAQAQPSSVAETAAAEVRYAHQTLIADGLSLAAMLSGTVMANHDNAAGVGVFGVGALGYAAATPTLHFVHRNGVAGGVSIVLRLVAEVASISCYLAAHPWAEYETASISTNTAYVVSMLALTTPILLDAVLAVEPAPEPKRRTLNAAVLAPSYDPTSATVGLQYRGTW